MTKTIKNKTLLLLVGVCLLFFLMAFISPALVSKADEAEDNALETAIDSADIEILDGAAASTLNPYVISWQIKIPQEAQDAITATANEAFNTKKDDYALLSIADMTLQARLLLFDESKLPTLSSGLNGVSLAYDVNPYQLGINLSMVDISNVALNIDGTKYYPEENVVFDVENRTYSLANGDKVYRFAYYTGADNVQTNYVPVLAVFCAYYTAGPLMISNYTYAHSRLIYNPNAVRSCATVSQRALDDEEFMAVAEDEDIAILNENVGGGQAADDLAESEVITNLETSYPLHFSAIAGATYDEGSGGITWKCMFNQANFDQWKTQANRISLWWMVLEYDDYVDTGNAKADFLLNHTAAVRMYPEYCYILDGTNYTSTLTYIPNAGEESTFFIAIPFIKVVGIKASATAGTGVPFEDVVSGTYVLCDSTDNARSVNSLLGDDGEYVYTFTYLEELEDKPFAIEKTKTITRTTRIDFNTMDMADFASIVGVDIDNKGNIGCLLSKVNHWIISQPTTTTYKINAMYSLIPLTFTNDKNQVEVQYLGLIPFSNIDGRNEYATLLTSLKDKDGVPYFESVYDVETTKLYGYFYTYAYETEYEDPNWTLNKDNYNGYISYFTSLENVSYSMGYMEIGSYGAIGGAVAGLIIGTIAGGPVGALVGAVVGGVAGFALAAGAGSLFGAEQDSHNIYYNIEYGFLDCTTMSPGGFYKTEADPELQVFEKVALAVVAVFELFMLASFMSKFKKLGLIPCIIFAAVLLGLFIWADIALYQFFLTGV